MTSEQFEALVRRLEVQSQRNPQAYKLKVILLGIAANVYVVTVLIFLLLLFLLALASIAVLKAFGIKIALVVGAFLWVVMKALWVRQAPPEGLRIKAKQAPELFRMINALRRELKAPRFHEVLVTDEFNAGVVQISRFGIFGWSRNYLLIGLPLMKSLTVDQFKAVLAHEFGHLAKAHGRFSNWIYRQRLRWERLVRTLEANQSNGTFLFKPFLNRFVPYFVAYSFPLARANEYEADAASVRQTSSASVAEALTNVNVLGRYLHERYWPQIYKQANDAPLPGFAPYSGMQPSAVNELDGDELRTWLERAMTLQTGFADTHPCLADRLKAIETTPSIRLPGPGEVADQLLGAALSVVADHFDRRWKDAVADSWERRYQEVQEGRQRLAALNGKAANHEWLSLDETYERARLLEDIAGDAEEALQQFRALHAIAPDNPAFCLTLASRLLAREDAAGVELAERAMRMEHRYTAMACELLRDYFLRNGEAEKAGVWQHKLSERLQQEQAASEERNQVGRREVFDVHGLSAEALDALTAQLRTLPGLRKAWLARKRVRHFPDQPCYVLGFRVTTWYGLYSDKQRAKVQQAIAQLSAFPGETIILSTDYKNAWFGRKIRGVRGSRIL